MPSPRVSLFAILLAGLPASLLAQTPTTPPPATPAPAVKPATPAPAPAPAPAATPAPKPATPAPKPAAPPATPKPAPPAATPPPKPANTPAMKQVEDKLAQFKTADELWAHFQNLQRGPRSQGNSPEERAKVLQEFVIELRATAERFAATYPTDPRRWEARITAARLTQKLPGPKPKEDVEKLYQDALTGSDTPNDIKILARLALIQMHREALKDDSPKEKVNDVEAEIISFIRDFPNHDEVPRLEISRAGLWEKRDQARAMILLGDLAKSANQAVAREASAQLRWRNLKKQPLSLKFNAVNSQPVDVEKLRGKVVLIVFWSTTHGGSVNELMKLVPLHEKLKDKGFEIVGITFDSNKDRLQAFLQEKNLAWPQYFDGKGFKNEIAAQYALRSIPAMWLVDKKGMVVSTDPKNKLEEQVTKLLSE